MLKKVSIRTAELIKEKIVDTGISRCPITRESLEIIFDWFDQEEISLANAEADENSVDRTYFNDICNAVNELIEANNETVDLEYLNELLCKM